ncbi:MAG TPA: D-arabinono-1,4-lactone oxidase [Pseudonocardia sp.]|nr:D-arabinono-1,4-lactone oxidase [Pseudonocardia sp.]
MSAEPAVWRNWSGRLQASPTRVVVPTNADEVAMAVKAAARDGLRVKPVGSGHSFSEIAVPDGVALRLDRMDRLVALDRDSGQVTVQGGITLHKLNPLLAAAGLALTNMGDIDRQTIAGATATGTHGTGIRFGGISTQIRAMELVLADGSRVRCAPDERPDLFAAARVGLGALGVVTEVTLQCEPLYVLRSVAEPMPLEQALDELHSRVDHNDHFEFFWFPHSTTALTTTNTRLPCDTPRRPIGRLRDLVENELLTNRVLELAMRVGTRVPAAIPAITRAITAGVSASETVDYSYTVFASQRDTRFNEGEFAIPRAAVVDVLREIKRWVDSHDERVSFPLEVRFVAQDDIWLAPTYRRDSAYIAFHQYHRLPYRRFFDAMGKILADVGGRPHWGKMHTLDAEALRPRYARFDDFVALRDQLDPTGVFTNDYLDRVLGPRP